MSDPNLTHQDEDLPAAEYGEEERSDHHDFGNWPELLGVILTAIVCWLIFAFTG
ncbi:hypothetical protein [Amorphus orientalis]|uniref:Uncharacterized protein n=1 Tax=Amorphus orientalis TaxID=649198 RepID=A0AAE3VLU7_9HYPH|nr:hypothetical protein [Amorphus orientalis]MDQ0314313.1 hypothetical protein [Amorphus orientalis]